MLEVMTLKTKEGKLYNDIIQPGHKEIMECILGRQAPDGSGKKRVHIMAHTRYGKSMAVGAATAIRAALKKEPWVIVAPTKDQAQIIMDYIIWFSVNDPILNKLLAPDVAKSIKVENLTQRRSRDHITYASGGEVRTFHAEGTMGFGSANVILDEAGLINNDVESRIFRMLGDHPDNFYIKIGNPWEAMDISGEEHHFYQSFIDEEYHHINIDSERGLAEGRLTESYLKEVRKRPNYDVLYDNLFPEVDKADKDGYFTLFTHAMLKKAMVEPDTLENIGLEKLGGDPADAGENEAVICTRSMNLAKIPFQSTNTDVLDFADKIAHYGSRISEWYVDKQGVGAGTVRKIQKNAQLNRRLTAINAGEPVAEHVKVGDLYACDIYANLRAYIFFEASLWLKQGGRLEKNDKWKQLLAVKWKNNSAGKVQIISKDILRKRKVNDLGVADAFSFTFAPKKKQMPVGAAPTGGVKPYAGEVASGAQHKPDDRFIVYVPKTF